MSYTKKIFLSTLVVLLLGCSPSDSKPTSRLSTENFLRIENGMGPSEVYIILGNNPKKDYADDMSMWTYSDDTADIVILLKNSLVVGKHYSPK